MILDYSHLLPEAITGPGDYIITYGPEPDMVFTVNVFLVNGRHECQFKFGIVPGLLLAGLFESATAVQRRVETFNRPVYQVGHIGNVSSDGQDVLGWPV